MELEVLLHFFKQKFYTPPLFIQKCNFICRTVHTVADKLVIPVLFILVAYFF